MEVGGTTSITSLPMSAQIEQMNPVAQQDNIKINNNGPQGLDGGKDDEITEQKTYNQLVSGLQQASAARQTELPSRDIPQDISPLIHDEQIQPNYIPPPEQADNYINDDETTQNIIDENKKNEENMNGIERLYQEFQLPILVAILYFMFQLPAVQKYIYKVIPSLFKSDGNPNIYGYIFNSIAFGSLYLTILKSMKYFSNI
jgi:hypothetical protein